MRPQSSPRGGAKALTLGALLLWGLAFLDVPVEANTNMTRLVKPTSDFGCTYNYQRRRCVPEEFCEYRYRFLDATFSESCRLRERRVHARPTYQSKIMTHPGILAAGATGLFLGDIAAIIFTPLLQRFPLTFNVFQGFILCFAGDTYFQILEQGAFKVKKVGLKVWRAARSGLIGSLNNGLIHYQYYKWIDRRFPYHLFTEEKFGKPESTYYKLSVAWFKYWLEWPTIGVYKIASMMTLTALLGGDIKGLPERFKKRFMLTWLRSLQVWPIYDTVLYAYVPASHRPLFNTFMSILWGGYLSHISQAEGDASSSGAASLQHHQEGKDCPECKWNTIEETAHKVEVVAEQVKSSIKKHEEVVVPSESGSESESELSEGIEGLVDTEEEHSGTEEEESEMEGDLEMGAH